jgi:hypothetical protein
MEDATMAKNDWPGRWLLTAINGSGRAMKLFRNTAMVADFDRGVLIPRDDDRAAFAFDNLQVAAVRRLFERPSFFWLATRD